MGAKEQGADATDGRWLVIPRNLCFITHGDDILLLKRGDHKRVFPGYYNGVGGHVERDEDLLSSAVREMTEETGLTVSQVRLRGTIHIDTGHTNGILVFVFSAEADSRDFLDSDEGTLEWVSRAQLDDLPLVEDLPILITHLFDPPTDMQPFFAHTSYDDQDRIVMRFAPDR